MNDVIGAVQAATLSGSVAARATIEGDVAASPVLGGVEIGGVIIDGSGVPAYEGEYSATPSETAQRFATRNRRMTADFIVNPIPSNYGRITWNGSVLTVS